MEYIEEETIVTAAALPWHLNWIRNEECPTEYNSPDDAFKPTHTGQNVDIYILDSG